DTDGAATRKALEKIFSADAVDQMMAVLSARINWAAEDLAALHPGLLEGDAANTIYSPLALQGTDALKGVSVTFPDNWAGGNIEIHGLDQNGAPAVDTITFPGGS